MSQIQQLRHYINGRFIEGADHHVVSNPANGQMLAHSPQASAQLVAQA
jgi:acyl-CoA reductase-like NAD-dependent aldehyde dehydrogenase